MEASYSLDTKGVVMWDVRSGGKIVDLPTISDTRDVKLRGHLVSVASGNQAWLFDRRKAITSAADTLCKVTADCERRKSNHVVALALHHGMALLFSGKNMPLCTFLSLSCFFSSVVVWLCLLLLLLSSPSAF